MKTVYCKVLLKTQDGLLQTTEHELRSMRPKLIPLLSTNCLCLGALKGHMGWWVWQCMTKHHPDPQADDMWWWPAVVPLLTTRCLYWGWAVRGAYRGVGGIGGYIWKMKTVYCKVLMKAQDSLLQTIKHELRSMGPRSYHSWPLDASTEGMSESQPDPKANQMSRWSDIILSSGQLDLCQYHCWPPDASTRGYIWLNVSVTQRMT